MIEKAKIIAKEIHKNQKRKFDGSPYFVHPESVANIVVEFKKSKHINELVSAAYLHDSIEDCGISFDYLQREFGYMVASIVAEVSNDFEMIKKYGKKHYMSNKVLTLSNYGLVIKLCDRLDNISDLSIATPDFRNKYTIETEYLVQILEDFRNLTETQKKLVTEIKRKIILK